MAQALRHDRKVLWLALLAGLPAVVIAAWFIRELPTRAAVPLYALIFGVWIGAAWAVRRAVVRPLATLSNLLAGVREGDFSVRARGGDRDDPLGLTLMEINALAQTLREQRLGAREATVLLETVMDAIDVAVLAFDPDGRLRLVNAAGSQLLGRRASALLGEDAESLGLGMCFDGETPRAIEIDVEAAPGQWELRRSTFRQGGEPMTLIVLADPGRILREQERQAWRRLIRVVSHEINNSLAPISSIVDSLRRGLNHPAHDSAEARAEYDEDLRMGLGVIGKRSAGLQRFMESYARLAKLPRPDRRSFEVGPWVQRVIALEERTELRVDPQSSAGVELYADEDQLEQLLINVVRNAVDATEEVGGGAIEIGWRRGRERFVLWIRDEGPGIANPANLFVPFFSTKAQGTGIGLVLSQQIAEAHGGSLTLRNRDDRRGAELRLELPLQSAKDEERGGAARSSSRLRVSDERA